MSGYSKNLLTLERMLPHLQPLVRGELCRWEVPEGEADRWAYKVREALYIAKLYHERLTVIRQQLWEVNEDGGAEFARVEDLWKAGEMAERFRVITVSPSVVETRTARGRTEAQVLTEGAPTSGLEDFTRPVPTVGRQTVATVKEAWKAAQPSNTPLYFPSAALSYEELVELYSWATQLHLLMFVADQSLTLQRKTSDLVAFAWSPRQELVEEIPDFPFKD